MEILAARIAWQSSIPETAELNTSSVMKTV